MSCFRRNDEKGCFSTFYEFINFDGFKIDKYKIYQTKINYTIVKWFSVVKGEGRDVCHELTD